MFNAIIAVLIVSCIFTIDLRWNHMTLLSSLLSNVRKETYGAIATILGALLGFEITALSILATFCSTRVMGRLHNKGITKPIIRTFAVATSVLGAGTLTALGGIFVDTDAHQNVLLEYSTLTLTLWAGLLLAATVLLINGLLKSVLDDNK